MDKLSPSVSMATDRYSKDSPEDQRTQSLEFEQEVVTSKNITLQDVMLATFDGLEDLYKDI